MSEEKDDWISRSELNTKGEGHISCVCFGGREERRGGKGDFYGELKWWGPQCSPYYLVMQRGSPRDSLRHRKECPPQVSSAPPVPTLTSSHCTCALPCALFLSRSRATFKVAPDTGQALSLLLVASLLPALPVAAVGSIVPASANRRGAHHRCACRATFKIIPAASRASPLPPPTPPRQSHS
jgi:hypothetical protein